MVAYKAVAHSPRSEGLEPRDVGMRNRLDDGALAGLSPSRSRRQLSNQIIDEALVVEVLHPV